MTSEPQAAPSAVVPRKRGTTLTTLLAGAILLLFLLAGIGARDLLEILRDGARPWLLLPFAIATAAILVLFGWRWRLLLADCISHRSALAASILCMGGNMFLPARGGDLLRVHHSHQASGLPHAKVLGGLVAEKVLDLLAVAALGLLAALMLRSTLSATGSRALLATTGTAFALSLSVVLLVRNYAEPLLRVLGAIARRLRAEPFFQRHVEPAVRDAGRGLAPRALLGPVVLTGVMWLGLYAPAYMLAAGIVGVPLGYAESLLVLFGGALGLMLPGAPSGLGTFHASVVSAFLLLHRPTAEGLLAATAIHLLFFAACAGPAALLYARWGTRVRS